MKNILLLLLVLNCFFFTGQSQDIHFSFAEANPLVLNPALAGVNYVREATVNYRSQWSSLGDPYKTTTAGFQSRIPNKRRNSGNTLALGVQFVNDRAGNPGIVSNSFSLVIADHVRISRESKLGVGLTIGLCQRAIRQPDGQWASQYNGVAFDASLGSGESFDNIEYRFADAGMGILYSYGRRGGTLAKNEDLLINAGLSVYHLNRPGNSFFDDSDERLPIRYSLFANADISIPGFDGAVMPGIYLHRQADFSELLLGAYYKFKLITDTRYTGFTKPLSLSVGMFGRIGDAAIAKMMLDWDQYSFGYAFDFNTSGLNPYSNGNGAHEIFLRFIMPETRPTRSSRF
jgi:type IX secretion system PorP/SprF family membrane protein